MPVAIARASIVRPKAVELSLRSAVQPNHRFGDDLHTARQAKLEAAANRLLAKAGFFEEIEEYEEEYVPWNVEMIGLHGLRPCWHGKA